jgi:hypothetical protein
MTSSISSAQIVGDTLYVGAPAFLPRDDGGDGPRVTRHSSGLARWNQLTASTAN